MCIAIDDTNYICIIIFIVYKVYNKFLYIEISLYPQASKWERWNVGENQEVVLEGGFANNGHTETVNDN